MNDTLQGPDSRVDTLSKVRAVMQGQGMFWRTRNCSASDSNFQILGAISASVPTHLERFGDLVSPPRPRQRPRVGVQGSRGCPGKDVKARGGWWREGEGAAGRGAKTQNAQHESPCQTPSTGRQLGAEDPGEEQRKKVRWRQPSGGRNTPGTASPAAPGQHAATPYLEV